VIRNFVCDFVCDFEPWLRTLLNSAKHQRAKNNRGKKKRVAHEHLQY